MKRTAVMFVAGAVSLAMLPLTGCGDDETTGGAGGQAGVTNTGGGGIGGQGGGGTGATGGAPTCDPSCEAGGHLCCGTRCLNSDNDILNCGECENECEGRAPFCDLGTCDTPPCDDPMTMCPAGVCCGPTCCDAGEICCVLDGGEPRCTDPANHGGTCPSGF